MTKGSKTQRGSELDSRGNKRNKYWSENEGPSETIQSHAAQGNIQEILKRYKQVGIVENLNQAQAQFLDVTAFDDFADVMRQAGEAQQKFMELPSKVREIFNHDVAEWLDTAHDDDKRAALVAAGWIEDPEVVAVPVAEAEPDGEVVAEG